MTVVVVGGGFGGINAVFTLAKREDLRIILIDKKNHHLFQPLLYQVATAGLAPSDIASPIRGIFSDMENVEVLMEEVEDVDKEDKAVVLTSGNRISFDFLILACGAEKNYFGHNEWEDFAPTLKSLEDALEIRRRLLLSYEKAETCDSDELRKALLTYVIVGGGPTGVELAGAIAEIAQTTLRSDFRRIRPEATEIYLLEAGPRILSAFPPELSQRAKEDLEKMKIKVLENTRVLEISPGQVRTAERSYKTCNVIWTAGVRASDLNKKLGMPLDRQGRVKVESDLSLPGHPDIFAIGDMAHSVDEYHGVLPGLAPVAMQQGRFVGQLILDRIAAPGTEVQRKFRYLDKGIMATIGRKRAVVQLGKNFRATGFIAWVFWLGIHVVYLIGFRNKAMVIFEWAWSYMTFDKGSRLIVGEPESPVPCLETEVGVDTPVVERFK